MSAAVAAAMTATVLTAAKLQTMRRSQPTVFRRDGGGCRRGRASGSLPHSVL